MATPTSKRTRWIYEVLPYLYVGSGVLVGLGLRNLWGAFSSIMLVSAGVIVWNMRRRHRHLARLREDQRLWKAAQKKESILQSQFVQLVWRKEYECGNPAIDAQHRNLFALGNTLLNAIMGGESKLDVELLFDELVEKVAQHFSTEEALMDQAHHPGAAEHRVAHGTLLARSKELAERFHHDQLDAGDLFNFIAGEVLARHILKEDLGALHRVAS